MQEKNKSKILSMTYIAIFAALISVCSWISIPTAIPFTLQTFAVFLTVAVLGGRRGTIAILVYITIGAVGVPVFAGFTGGLGVVFGNTGGYIVGFIFTALIMWLFEKFFGNKLTSLAISMVIGLIFCYVFGTAWFMFFYTRNTGSIGLMTALGSCVFPFVLPDVIKIIAALLLNRKLKRFIKI